MSVSSALSGLTGRAQQDAEIIKSLGENINKKESAFNAAVKTGDPSKIALAQNQFEKASQALQAKMGLMATINRMIDQIIQRIGQIGQ